MPTNYKAYDIQKLNIIKEKTGFNAEAAIKNNRLAEEDSLAEKAEAPVRRVKLDTNSTERKVTPRKYDVVNRG